jgi:hypothetical protein
MGNYPRAAPARWPPLLAGLGLGALVGCLGAPPPGASGDGARGGGQGGAPAGECGPCAPASSGAGLQSCEQLLGGPALGAPRCGEGCAGADGCHGCASYCQPSAASLYAISEPGGCDPARGYCTRCGITAPGTTGVLGTPQNPQPSGFRVACDHLPPGQSAVVRAAGSLKPSLGAGPGQGSIELSYQLEVLGVPQGEPIVVLLPGGNDEGNLAHFDLSFPITVPPDGQVTAAILGLSCNPTGDCQVNCDVLCRVGITVVEGTTLEVVASP